MPKTKISEFSATPANNTDIDSINIAEGCAPSGINDAIRELMAQLKDFQTGAVGDSFNGPVGTSTAAAGAFTTLSSTGNTTLGDASGDAVTINGTTTFANANPTLTAGTANGVTYLNGSKVLTSGSALVFDGANLGLGVTPSASSVKTFEIGAVGLGLTNRSAGKIALLQNAYFNSGFKYAVSGMTTAMYEVDNGTHYWYNAPSGTAGNAISFTNSMLLDTSGNLGLGLTPSGSWGTQAFILGKSGASNPTYPFITSTDSQAVFVGSNSYWDGTNFKAQFGGAGVVAMHQKFNFNAITWHTAPAVSTGTTQTFTQAMTLDANGNLGIATTSPATKLHVAGEITTSSGVIGSTTTGSVYFAGGSSANNGAGILLNGGSHPFDPNLMLFRSAGTERARIDASGNLLVGKTSPNTSSGTGVEIRPTGTVAVVAPSTTGDTYDYYNSTAGAFRFYVTNAGVINATSTSITAISDLLLKENVRDIDTGLNAIMELKPRRFDWKEGKGQDKKDVAGFIAQEFETVFPECVGTTKAGGDGIEYKNINHETLIPTLVKAMQELKTEFDAYKASHP